jgi:hypothetical protein
LYGSQSLKVDNNRWLNYSSDKEGTRFPMNKSVEDLSWLPMVGLKEAKGGHYRVYGTLQSWMEAFTSKFSSSV